MDNYDVIIIGGGILGVSTAYILSSFTKASVILLEKELRPAVHASSRNTGVIHRPFYLDPSRKRIYAQVSQWSYPMWRDLAKRKRLPFVERGTIEVSLQEEDVKHIEEYSRFAQENGMEESEYSILNKEELLKLEPNVKAESAFFSRTDTNVSFGKFTEELFNEASNNGLKVLFGVDVISVNDEMGEFSYVNQRKKGKIRGSIIINVAGGESLRIARTCGLANQYGVLHFRGDYWRLNSNVNPGITHNIYSVPRHLKYPFLDPHFIIRPDGTMELGPNAYLVSSPYRYPKEDENFRRGNGDLFSLSLLPKLKLFTSPEFISLVRKEWKSSTHRLAMVNRVKAFIPNIDESMIVCRGLSGIRHSLVDRNGFVPEAIIEKGNGSIHVLNYNSPGATGAPAYAMYIYSIIQNSGLIEKNRIAMENKPGRLWNEDVNKLQLQFT